MKSYKQFCEDAYQLNEFNIKPVLGKIGRVFGADIAGEVIKKASGNNPIVSKVADVATAGVGLGRLAGPIATGVALGTQVAAPAAIKLAQQRRSAQQSRLNQLVPSGRPGYAGPAQIVPSK